MKDWDLTLTHYRDMAGRLLWVKDFDRDRNFLEVEGNLLPPQDGKFYEVKRVALVENTQHVNLELIEEVVIVTEPHL